MTNRRDSAPLRAIRVLERTTSRAGQVAGMLLCDLGADVVRLVDDGPADAARTGLAGWLCWNRGKTIAAAPSDSDVDRLVARADVLITDDSPSAHSVVAAPGLVQVWMPPVAASGRWSELPADHLLLDALAGFSAHHQAVEDRPVVSVVPTRHILQGELAAVAALAGLYGRERDGWGRAAIVTGLHAEAAAVCTLGGISIDGPPLIGASKLLPSAPHFRLWQAGDDQWLFMASLSPVLFIKALEVLDRLDVLAHPVIAGEFLNVMRPDAARIIGAELDATFATRSRDEWLDLFAAAEVPAAPVGDPATWLKGDVIANACPPVTRSSPDVGAVTMPGPPATLAATPAVVGELPSPGTVADPSTLWRDVEPVPAPSGPPPGDDDRPLAGIRVVDASTFLAGPFISTLLAAHGADVVKVEAPSGDPYSVFTAPYGLVNEHKPRLVLDLRRDAERDAFLELVSVADVVVDNLLASSLERLDLRPDRFEAVNKTLVRCSLTAFGASGPFAERPGFDPVMQCLSGLVAIQGGDDRPVATGAPIHDIAGGCAGAIGTLAALLVRRREGLGQRVFTSLAAASTLLQSGEMTTYAGRPPRPTGGRDFPGPSAGQHLYQAADRWIAVSATTAEHEAALLEVVDRSDVADADDDVRAAAIGEVVARRPADHWVGALAAAGVPACAAVNRMELDDPFLAEQQYSHVIDTPDVGRMRVISGYTDWDGRDRRPPLPVEQLSTDQATVLARWTV